MEKAGGERGRALVVRRPGEVVLEERDFPAPGPDAVLIRPDTVGLCGTDLDIVAGRVDPAYTRYPLVLGHEWSGTVAGPLAEARAGSPARPVPPLSSTSSRAYRGRTSATASSGTQRISSSTAPQ